MAVTRLERLRRHRELMEIAIAEGLSLDDARGELVRRHAAARDRARQAVSEIRADVPTMPIRGDEPREPRFWWERD